MPENYVGEGWDLAINAKNWMDSFTTNAREGNIQRLPISNPIQFSANPSWDSNRPYTTGLKGKGGKRYAAILSDYDYSNYLKDHPEHVKAADATNDEQTAELFVKISDPAITSSQFVAVTYKNEKLLTKINSTIVSMHDDGTLQELSQKYLSKDISLQ